MEIKNNDHCVRKQMTCQAEICGLCNMLHFNCFFFLRIVTAHYTMQNHKLLECRRVWEAQPLVNKNY